MLLRQGRSPAIDTVATRQTVAIDAVLAAVRSAWRHTSLGELTLTPAPVIVAREPRNDARYRDRPGEAAGAPSGIEGGSRAVHAVRFALRITVF